MIHEYSRHAFSLGLIGAAVLIPLAVVGQIEFALASSLTLITGGSYIVSYVFGGKYKALLNADRKLYILYIADCISIIISCILRVIALESGYSIVVVQCINLACVLIKNLCYVSYVKKKYGLIDYSVKPDYLAVKKRWNVLIHSLAGLVVNHTDIIFLTVFSNLKVVSVYSVYNMVFGQLSTMVQTTFMHAPQSNFGYLYNKDRNSFEVSFGIYETGFSILLFIITTIALVLVLPFILIYTKGITDITYQNNYLPILFALILLMNQIRIPALLTINIAGAFKETQKGAIIEAIINLIVSLVLFFFTPLGIYGLLIGTVCSYIFRTTDIILFVYNHLLNRSKWRIAKILMVNSLTLAEFYVFFRIIVPITAYSYLEWTGKAIVVSPIIIFGFLTNNYMLNRDETKRFISFCMDKTKTMLKPRC